MANRYWVGGNANWDGAVGTKWSASSGGPGGASVPNFVDDVFFDAASGPVTCQYIGAPGVKSINCTGFTGTLAGTADIEVSGSITLVPGMTYSHTGEVVIAATGTVTTAGKPLKLRIFCEVGDTVTLADNLIASNRTLRVTRGTFNAANFNLNISIFESSDDAYPRAVNMGSGTWTIQNVWNAGGASKLTINPGTSTISMVSPFDVDFAGGGKTYYNLRRDGAGALTILGSNTFNNITNTVQPTTIRFAAGTTQTVSNFGLSGTFANLVTIESETPGSRFNLSKPSGAVNVQCLRIKDSNATGGATWNAVASQDLGNNLGWLFSGGNTFLTFM